MARRNMIDENQIEMVVVERPNEKGPAELVISPKLPEKAVKLKLHCNIQIKKKELLI